MLLLSCKSNLDRIIIVGVLFWYIHEPACPDCRHTISQKHDVNNFYNPMFQKENGSKKIMYLLFNYEISFLKSFRNLKDNIINVSNKEKIKIKIYCYVLSHNVIFKLVLKQCSRCFHQLIFYSYNFKGTRMKLRFQFMTFIL